MASRFPNSLDENTASVSASSDINQPLSGTCGVCNEEFQTSDLYRCVTCHSTNDDQIKKVCDTSDGIMLHEFLCENCIVGPHLRRKHEIIDHKGYIPAVCNKHKNLSRLFCNDCKLVFCSSCIIAHKNHDFISVAEKGVQSRKQIFDYLSQLELVMKPVKHQEDVAKNSLEEITKFSDGFREENVSNSLCKFFTRAIENNDAEWCKIVSSQSEIGVTASSTDASKVAHELAGDNERFVENLRSLFQKSDGVCVQSLLGMETTVKSSIEKQNARLRNHLFLEWSLNTEEIVKSSIRDLLARIKTPQLTSIVYKKVILNSQKVERVHSDIDWNKLSYDHSGLPGCIDSVASELLNVTYRPDSVEFSILIKLRNRQNLTIASYKFNNCPVKKILKHDFYIAFFLSERSVCIYCLETKCITEQLNLGRNLDPLAFQFGANESFFFITWNIESSRIELNYPEGHAFLECESKPKLFETFHSISVLVYPNYDVVVYNWPLKTKVHISKLHHGLSQIDRVHLNGQSLELLDFRMGISLEGKIDFTLPNFSFCVTQVVDLKPQVFAINSIVFTEGKCYVIAEGNFYAGIAEKSMVGKFTSNLASLGKQADDRNNCDRIPFSMKMPFQLPQKVSDVGIDKISQSTPKDTEGENCEVL